MSRDAARKAYTKVGGVYYPEGVVWFRYNILVQAHGNVLPLTRCQGSHRCLKS